MQRRTITSNWRRYGNPFGHGCNLRLSGLHGVHAGLSAGADRKEAGQVVDEPRILV